MQDLLDYQSSIAAHLLSNPQIRREFLSTRSQPIHIFALDLLKKKKKKQRWTRHVLNKPNTGDVAEVVLWCLHACYITHTTQMPYWS